MLNQVLILHLSILFELTAGCLLAQSVFLMFIFIESLA